MVRKPAAAIAEVKQLIQGRIASRRYRDGDRLPPERHLAIELGTSRTTLRKALSQIEADGHIWRHVGKGTFIGRAPQDDAEPHSRLAWAASPREIIEARLSIEPVIAGYAAHSATKADVAYMMKCVERLEGAREWPTFETWDQAFHRAVAASTRNVVFLSFLETINQLRRGEPWVAINLPDLQSERQRQNTEKHRMIVEAIAAQDMHGAMHQMRTHLDGVKQLYIDVPILPSLQASLRAPEFSSGGD